MHVLVVEDNRELAENIGLFLGDRHHIVDYASDGRTGLRLASAGSYDAIILDIGLPAMDGLELCERFRNETKKVTPVLFVTARDSLDDKLRGFASGADDYLIKPFSLLELEARLIALVRRSDRRGSDRITWVADLEFDANMLTVSRGGQRIALKPMALKVLALLCRASPRIVTRAELEREIWGNDVPEDDVLRAHIYAIRNAIDRPFPVKLLHTVHGVGFRLSADS
jgi:DNA-binding response OmpR family regulator